MSNKKPSKGKDQVEFSYIFADTYNPVYVNGVHGGITPTGDIVANYYFERHPLPYSDTYKIDGNTVGEKIATKPDKECMVYVRYVSTGTIMGLEAAKNFHAWLGERITELEKMISVKQEKSLNKENEDE